MSNSILQRVLSYFSPLLERSSIPFLLLKSLYSHVFINIQTVQVFLINGLVKNTNYSITTLFIGSEESAYQFAYLIHSKIDRITPLGKFLLRRFDPSNLHDVELIVFKTKGFLTSKLLRQGYFLLPDVDFSLSLRRDLDQIIKRSSRRRRRSIKKFQDSSYSYKISRNNKKDFDYFYWKMYLPYIKKRFGRATIPSSYSTLKALYRRNGGIIFVKNGEEYHVGLLFWTRGKTLYTKSLGILEKNQRFRMGLAGQAALFFLIKWAKDEGIESLNYGVTMPFFSDGIFIYKKEWGMDIQQHGNKPFCALKFSCLNESTLSLLQQNPFIFLDRGVMKGLFLINYRPTKQDLQKIFSKYFLPRLDSLVIIAYYSYDKKTTTNQESSTTSEKFTDTLLQSLSTTCLSMQKRGFVVEVHTLKC